MRHGLCSWHHGTAPAFRRLTAEDHLQVYLTRACGFSFAKVFFPLRQDTLHVGFQLKGPSAQKTQRALAFLGAGTGEVAGCQRKQPWVDPAQRIKACLLLPQKSSQIKATLEPRDRSCSQIAHQWVSRRGTPGIKCSLFFPGLPANNNLVLCQG